MFKALHNKLYNLECDDYFRNELTEEPPAKRHCPAKETCENDLVLKERLQQIAVTLHRRRTELPKNLKPENISTLNQNIQNFFRREDIIKSYNIPSLILKTMLKFSNYDLIEHSNGNRISYCTNVNTLVFSGCENKNYGLIRYDIETKTQLPFIEIDKSVIRDVKCAPKYLALSVSEQYFSISHLKQGKIFHEKVIDPITCTWTPHKMTFFIGHENGKISYYDLRNVQHPLEQFHNNSPVISMNFIEKNTLGNKFLCCTKNYAFIGNLKNEKLQLIKYLNITGPFLSSSFNVHTNHLLITAKNTDKHKYVRHYLYDVTNMKNGPRIIQGAKFDNNNLRSIIFSFDVKEYVVAFNESKGGLNFYNTKTTESDHFLEFTKPVFDICFISNDAIKNKLIAYVSEKDMHIDKVLKESFYNF